MIYQKILKCFKISLSLVFINIAMASAQDITAIDFEGKVIGKVIPDGTAINFNNEIMGQLTADSFIVNSKGVIVGGIIPQGFAIGNDHKYLGKVTADGTVRLPSGKVAGQVLPNGLVVDKKFDIIGAVLSSGLVYNDLGEAVGRLAGNGAYINLNGQSVGFVSPSGYAYRQSDNGVTLEGKLLSNKMVVSLDGSFIGSVAPGGQVTDFEGKFIGSIHANGYVYADNDKIIGRTIKTAYAFDDLGHYLGIVSYNGEVVQGGKTIGRLRADDKIVDMKGSVIGFSVALNAIATDMEGKYLGYLIPEGKIVKAQNQVVGIVGPRGVVFDQKGNVVGKIAETGPIFDYLGRLKAEAMPNGQAVSFGGASLGMMKGKIAFDNADLMMGSVIDEKFITDSSQRILGLTGISSEFVDGSQQYKISPFGYVYNVDNVLTGQLVDLSPAYTEEGSLFGYVDVSGTLDMPEGENLKLKQNGLVVDEKGEIKARQITPIYNVFSDEKISGNLSETNVFYDKKDHVVAKIVPEYKIVGAKNLKDDTVMPVVGLTGSELGVVVDVKGDKLGYIDFWGNVFNGASKIGRLDQSGLVLNAKNAFVGEQVPFRTLVNSACENIGVVGPKGEARNGRDNILGKTLPNGRVISEVGQNVGYIPSLGPVYDFNGKILGQTNQFGQVQNSSGQTEGCLDARGRLYKQGEAFVGRVVGLFQVMDFENKIIGRVNIKNQFVNNEGKVLGFALPDGTVLSEDGKILGLTFRYRFAFDRDNNFIGRVDDNGQVLDENNKVFGTVNYDGLVVSKSKAVGYALYDLYVYDENDNVVGYLSGSGKVMNFAGTALGKADRGFLVNKEGFLIGRGHRDYFIRDKKNTVIGELLLSGDMVDMAGKVTGSVSGNGDVRDETGKLLATARPLQYYVAKAKKSADWAETPDTDIKVEPIEVSGFNEEPLPSYSQKVIGVVVSPDGNYLGDLLDSGVAINPKTGEVIGYEKDGLVFDGDNNLLGVVEKKSGKVESPVFLPQDAYGISNVPSNLGPGGGFGPNERYDPVRARMLAEAQKLRQKGIQVGKLSSGVNPSTFTGYQDGWDNVQKSISSWRVDMSKMILADKPIPAVLARTIMDSGVASDVPVTAIVERNVYAEDGRNIVIPAGSRVMGQSSGGSSGGNSGGAVRTSITWTRLIRPDGSAFEFASAQTGDAQGRGGALGYLDEQLLKKYTLPLATKMMTDGLAYVMAKGQTTTSSDGNTTSDSRANAAEDARQDFLEGMDQIFQEILESKTRIEAVTYVPAGTRLIIYPKVDLWLRTPERDEEESVKNLEKPKQLLDDARPIGENQFGSASASRGGGSSNSDSKVVYNGDDNVTPSSSPLINNTEYQNNKQNRQPTGATPPPPSTTTTSTNSGSDNSAASLF